ncbi:Ig-like domain-containing protein, partial [Alistipes putredinis]|uniref:Ig-like domain-containing protein n=1 Tax=Alistipes putredinis TaxID=28117 RepID=UPI003AF19449
CKVTVSDKEVKVTGVKLNKTATSIFVGDSETLTATITPENATNQKVTWKSSDTAIATVDAAGKVTGVKAGEATITVTTEDGGKTAACKVTVSNKEIKVTGVKLNKTATSLLVGGNETLVATILPENATNKKVTWKSSNAAVATVDAAGKVTGVKAGEATITVTTDDGGKTATCKVTVSNKEVNVTGVTLNKATLTLIEGASETLTATVAPADATNQKVTWKSSNAAVATVDATGKVTAVKAGEATITVTTEDGAKTATCKVTVKAATVAVTGVTLNKSALTLIAGASETLTATVAPANATNKKVTWKSSNAAVATVDAAGKVTAVKAGEATITVTTEDGAKTAACKVTVTMPVSGVTLNKTALTLNIGANETLTATVAPANATNKKVTWKSSNAAVATVDANGKVTAVKAGEATITVTTEDGGKTATCKVTVKPNLVSEITLAALAIYVGESKAITATVKPDDATNKALTWKSSDATVATVDATGKVTGKKIGTATITATAQDGSGVSGSCTVTVLSAVKKVTVEPANLTLGKNKSYTLTATVDAQPGTDTGVTWTSSDTTIATVDATGKVTTTDKVGTVTITATSKADPAKKGTCTIKVSGDQTDIGYGEYGPEENW